MKIKKLPKSVRKYVRFEKCRIRREAPPAEREKLIAALYAGVGAKPCPRV